MSEFILGVDIGYSNLVIVSGDADGDKPMDVTVMPSGAGPIELMPQALMGGVSRDKAVRVVVDGKPWVAGVEPDPLQGWSRELHSEYPFTNVYRSLFYTALLISGRDVIDILVTGLPVNQHMDTAFRERVASSLKGEHQITPKRTVTVKNVIVVPQPAGAYMNTIYSTDDDELLEIVSEGRTVIIDPGFFSVDWVTLEGGEVRYQSSGTDLKAMSKVIEEAALLIEADHGSSPCIERIERAIRGGKSEMIFLGQKISIDDYLKDASQKVARAALVPMRTSLREEGTDVDVVILAGGGAQAYKRAAADVFPRSRIIISKEPVAANAQGFWYCAK